MHTLKAHIRSSLRGERLVKLESNGGVVHTSAEYDNIIFWGDLLHGR